MMEPLNPRMRDALKEAHPGLTNEIIDQYEELIHERFQLDPEDRVAIARIDVEIEGLLKQHMPHYRQVSQLVSQEIRLERGPRPRKVTIRRKRIH
jgi:hypothetical protein